jgi:hypothetical protein
MFVSTEHNRTGEKQISDIIRERRRFLREYIERVNPQNAKLIGAWVRCFHFMAPIACIIFVGIGPKWVAKLFIGLLVAVVGMYWYFRGCIATWLEKKLCREDINIADWLLVALEHDTNSHNRNVITLFFFPFYFAFVVSIYYYRFG